jgi:hypothetical protein
VADGEVNPLTAALDRVKEGLDRLDEANRLANEFLPLMTPQEAAHLKGAMASGLSLRLVAMFLVAEPRQITATSITLVRQLQNLDNQIDRIPDAN